MGKFATLLSIIVLIIVIVAIGPLLTIWAANTLFPALAIPFTIETWAAVVLLGMFFRANVSIKKN
jgi:hypothetical protein